MTETKNLKEETERSKVLQQFEELNAYIETLISEMQHTSSKSRDAWIVYLVVWFCWVVAGFVGGPLMNNLFTGFFIIAMVYSNYRVNQYSKAVSEFKGAMNILKILGMVPPSSEGNRNKKRRKVWNEGADLVKGWFGKKKQAQEEAYAPA